MVARLFFDLVDPAELTQYIRAFDDEVLRNDMGLEQFLPNTPNDDLEYRIARGTRKDVDVAEYRAFDTAPRMTGRQGFSRIRGELAPVSRMIPLTEEERLRLRALQNTGSGGKAAMIKQIYDDAELMVRAVQMRLEVGRGQVLTTGKFTLTNENGLTLEADYGMPGSHRPTVGTAWSNPASDIIGDIMTNIQLFVDDNGVMPETLVTSRTVLGYMLNNTAMRQLASFNGTTPTRINVDTVDAILASNGIPPVALYDTKARINGVLTNIIPNDKVLFMAPEALPIGQTQYGITAEAMVLAEEGYIEESAMPGVVAVNYRNDSPVQTFTAGHAIALPVLGDPLSVICLDVIP